MRAQPAMRAAVVLALAWLQAGDLRAEPAARDLTIELGGDLLTHGGVVVVYPIPTSTAAGESGPGAVRIDERYAEVQLRYPRGGTYAYRLRPVAGTADAKAHATEVLSIVGTDEEGRGPQMSAGFEKAYSSGGRVIRVPALAELSGADDATRTDARWGRTQGYKAVPPADRQSARALVSVVEYGPKPATLRCVAGGRRVQVCTVAQEEWTGLTAQWWRAIADQRLGRLEDHALRRCYDQAPDGSTCEPVPK
ncbi:hypothetical protein [Methylobacterium iners]|nr:hypothetical protein [Methylobacterium iners]